MMEFILDERLKNDSHILFDWQEITFLLNKNASIPWIILVPHSKELELLDLPERLLNHVLHASKIVQDVLRENDKAEKINFASIGNVVSQLHIHIVGRSSNDSCWPNVVWGSRYEKTDYSLKEIQQLIQEIQNKLL